MFSPPCIPLLSSFLPFPEQMSPLMRRNRLNSDQRRKGSGDIADLDGGGRAAS